MFKSHTDYIYKLQAWFYLYLQNKSEGQHLIHVNMYNLGFVIHRTSSLNKNLSNSNHSIVFESLLFP